MDLCAAHDMPRRHLLTVTGVAGIAFTLSWIAGLSVAAPSPKLTASGAEIAAALAGHGTAVAAQFALTEGLPAAGLAVVSIALTRAARRSGAAAAARVALIAGVGAAVISVAQFALGMVLAGTSAPGPAHMVYEAVNRLDGVKMFALAILGLAGAASGSCPGGCGTPGSRSLWPSPHPASPTCCSCRAWPLWPFPRECCCWSSSPVPASRSALRPASRAATALRKDDSQPTSHRWLTHLNRGTAGPSSARKAPRAE